MDDNFQLGEAGAAKNVSFPFESRGTVVRPRNPGSVAGTLNADGGELRQLGGAIASYLAKVANGHN